MPNITDIEHQSKLCNIWGKSIVWFCKSIIPCWTFFQLIVLFSFIFCPVYPENYYYILNKTQLFVYYLFITNCSGSTDLLDWTFILDSTRYNFLFILILYCETI